MNVVEDRLNDLSIKRIKLQNTFTEYNEEHGFSYEQWVSPPAGSFYEGYKKELADIDNEMAPPLQYQT
jgi:hypothetical protein